MLLWGANGLFIVGFSQILYTGLFLFSYRWPYAKTAETVKELGCKHINKHVTEVHVDVKNKLVTTSAFMCNAPIHEIYDGIGKMVKEVIRLA